MPIVDPVPVPGDWREGPRLLFQCSHERTVPAGPAVDRRGPTVSAVFCSRRVASRAVATERRGLVTCGRSYCFRFRFRFRLNLPRDDFESEFVYSVKVLEKMYHECSLLQSCVALVRAGDNCPQVA
ncbi:hypothetical protein GUJ93_ZPchr0001g31319 [Zizania palustris]|uniref:Uncharacterized protein n=1 Tax=Zizania palustris TaxID=103762 RepID=A0A8J5RQL5_ZIZPA|nr:hypothetical protein GUJ93_ZPchr0001g31319 [Zizania palustris]